jgi:hypothetical protein
MRSSMGTYLGDDDGGSGPTMLDAVPEIMRHPG